MELLEKLKELFPKNTISKVELEGCEIVVYTRNLEFFKNSEETIRNAVSTLKKRIELRVEKDLLPSEAEVREKINELIPAEAEVTKVYFEPERSVVIIAAKKPGLVIGKGGETFKKLKKEILWSPKIERVPSLKSEIVESIRKMMHSELKFRKKFLNRVGEKVFVSKPIERNWIRIIGLGGFSQVGRSCLLLETPKSKILLDCGINVGGKNNEVYPILNTKEFDLNEIDAVIISHAHLDHCGFLPYLYEHGYDGPTYMTVPTLDLFALLALDYIDVMQKSVNSPLYTAKGVKEAIKHTIALEYGEVSDITNDIRLTFQNAGHILGSALVHLNVGEGLHNVLYALDQKFGKTYLLDPAFTDFQRVETLIIEATYGGKRDIMPPRYEVEKQFMQIVNETMQRNGIVLIPSFSVERAQEVMAILVENNFDYPVFLDGMIWDANGIFSAYPEYLSKSMQRKIFRGEDPFLNPIFKRIASRQDREKAWEAKPCVIISTSGMLVGGPVMEHLKQLAEDENNTLIFVGYQAEGTMGRRIQKGWREIPFQENGKTITLNLKMRVETVEGLSGHSDRRQLLAFIGKLKAKPNKIIVMHGEPRKVQEFSKTVERVFRIESVAPKNLEAIRLK
ncbi:MAG TPA: beta-CASP ribonuclease aCPSF1 [Candidatus Aenigmarchaeota archaeon]|nr:beta-CASP ribonuclease aCPSF1 [Candidatus Aenigmarchaeota archaeon]